MTPTRRALIGGHWVEGASRVEVRSPWNDAVASSVAQVSLAQVHEALSVAVGGRARLQAQSAGHRRGVLLRMVEGLRHRAAELAEVITAESGKPISASKVEVSRALETFSVAAAHLAHFGGGVVPVDLADGAQGTEAEVRRFPVGVVVGIVPFNFALNLGAHKVAPALAVGAPIIIKPPPQAPSAQLILGEVALAAGADPAALQVVPCDTSVAQALATDERVRVMSFTGSAKVGWQLKGLVSGKAVLELGGNAAAIVCADADVPRAVERLCVSAFNAAGQVCIKVQRVVIEAPAWERFVAAFVERARQVRCGDPALEEVMVGPVIDAKAAARIEAWVDEAVAHGARVLLRGARSGCVIPPVVLTDVAKHEKVAREEVFGPVVVLERVETFDAALGAVNDSPYGLQAAVFTNDLAKVRRAFHELEVGGVIVNDAPSFRSDNMPYGGVKGSGLGREGVRWAMEDFTEERVLVYRP